MEKVESPSRSFLIQELVNSLGLDYGTIEIKVKDKKWVHTKVSMDFNKNECDNLEIVKISEKIVDKC